VIAAFNGCVKCCSLKDANLKLSLSFCVG